MSITNKEARVQVENKVKAMHEQIMQAKSTQVFQDYLKFITSSHALSFYNSMLVFSQVGNKQTMSKTNWNKNDRQVSDYSEKVWILAPLFGFGDLKDEHGNVVKDENDKPVKTKFLRGFKWVYHYTFENTTGKPLPVNPLEATWELSENEIGQKYYPIFKNAMIKNGVKYHEYEATNHHCKGSTNGEYIRVLESLSDTDKFLVGVHEYAHYLLHFDTDRPLLSKERKELEAETVAWLIAEKLGIESNSVNYNALYHKDYDLMDSIGNIFKAYDKILKMIGLKQEYSNDYKKRDKANANQDKVTA